MVHIPQDKILPQDMVDLWEIGEEGPRRVRMHAVDARHAMHASPAIYSLDLPPVRFDEPEKPEKPEKEEKPAKPEKKGVSK